MLPNILFVDDDERILSALKRMLRTKRNEWNCDFANGGRKALAMLEEKDFDVIVSDMRMPEMNGAELLDEVRKKHPGTIRIVLSGFAEEQSVLNTISSAHQYLAKPCDKENLTETLKRALSLRTFLDKSTAACVVGEMNRLATIPSVLAELKDEINSPDASVERLGQIVSRDIALTAQTLRITNSAYFGVPVGVTSAGDAIRFLGMDTFRSIVLSVGIFDECVCSQKDMESVTGLNDESLAIGALVEKICQIENLDSRATKIAIAASSLSHIGSLILMTQWSDLYDDILVNVKESGRPVVDEEQRTFNVSHPELGAYLLGAWGFPELVVEAVAFHHSPSESDKFDFGPLTILHASQCLIRPDFDIDLVDQVDPNILDLDYIGRSGAMSKLRGWADAAKSLQTQGIH